MHILIIDNNDFLGFIITYQNQNIVGFLPLTEECGVCF